MKGNKIQRKRGGKASAVLSFFIGLLFGIIVILGALGGGVYFLLTGKIDNILSFVGVDNSKNKNGDNKYINTDPDDGGVETLLDLISKIYTMAGDYKNLTLGQIDELVPSTRGLVERLADSIAKYVEIDYAELREVKFSRLGNYFQEIALDIQPAVFLEDQKINLIMEMVLCGVEANYVTDPSSGNKYPLFVDSYAYDSEAQAYKRVGDDEPLNPSQEKYIVQKSANSSMYDLFFFSYDLEAEEKEYFIAERDPDNVMNFFTTEEPYGCNEEIAELTGNFYYDNNGEKQIVDPVTVRSLMDGDGMGALDRKLLLELISDSGNHDELMNELLGDITLGDFLSGKVDMQERIDSMAITLLMDIEADDAIMSYLGYGITKVARNTQTDEWTAMVKLEDGTVKDCMLAVDENGKITDVYYDLDGQEVHIGGTTVGEIGSRMKGLMEDMTVGELINLSDDNNIILNALKDSTINNIGKTIEALTLNELYADEIYKHVVYVDENNDGQADKDNDGNPIVDEVKVAKLRIAVKSLDDIPAGADPDDYVLFHRGYIYYRDGRLVNAENDKDNGKLTPEEFGDGKVDGELVYYTYGATNSLWRLLLGEKTETDGEKYIDEKVLSLNSIGDIITNVSTKITGSTLRELDEAGIIDFKTADLELVVDNRGTPDDESDDIKLGDLELIDALTTLIEMLQTNR